MQQRLTNTEIYKNLIDILANILSFFYMNIQQTLTL